MGNQGRVAAELGSGDWTQGPGYMSAGVSLWDRERAFRKRHIGVTRQDLLNLTYTYLDDDDVCLEVSEPIADDVDFIGYGMGGGTILIHGDAGRGLGKRMSGGRIVVDGLVGEGCGEESTGGTIVVLFGAGRPRGRHVGAAIVEGDEAWRKDLERLRCQHGR